MRHSTIGSWYGYPQHEDLNYSNVGLYKMCLCITSTGISWYVILVSNLHVTDHQGPYTYIPTFILSLDYN